MCCVCIFMIMSPKFCFSILVINMHDIIEVVKHTCNNCLLVSISIKLRFLAKMRHLPLSVKCVCFKIYFVDKKKKKLISWKKGNCL